MVGRTVCYVNTRIEAPLGIKSGVVVGKESERESPVVEQDVVLKECRDIGALVTLDVLTEVVAVMTTNIAVAIFLDGIAEVC